MALDLERVRSQFPALARAEHGRPVAHLDGPAGTQVPNAVIDATSRVYSQGVANLGGLFGASRDADRIVREARGAIADLFGAADDQIVFGQNMTSLTFAMSRSLAREWDRSTRVVITQLDHEANRSPWQLAAADRGASIDDVPFDPVSGMLSSERVVDAIRPSTRLVAVTAASNALGSVTDLEPIVAAAHDVGALVFVDAVHFSAHRLSDMRALGADLLVASSYKFFGPHTGILCGTRAVLDAASPYKLPPAPETSPDRWETGTQSFEAMAGVTAAVDYLANLGEGASRRGRLVSAFEEIRRHEETLTSRFLAGIEEMPAVTLHGPPAGSGDRVSTFAITIEGTDPAAVARRLGEQGIYTWSGHYYAVTVMERLGLADSGGAVRIGFVHYTSPDEVDRVLEALAAGF